MSQAKIDFMLSEIADGADPEDLGTVVHATGWKDNGRHQNAVEIIETDDGTYAVYQSRSGSYFTEWDYDEPIFNEVEVYYEDVPTLKWRKIG